jgi:hypothetical protein
VTLRPALATVLAALVPATPARAERLCPAPSPEPPRYEAVTAESPGAFPYTQETLVVLCDNRTGRERLLRRGRFDPRSVLGTVYGGAAAGRGRVAWIEAAWSPRNGGRRWTAHVEVRSIATGRRLRRFVAGRRTADTSRSGVGSPDTELGVAFTPRQGLAWLAGGKVVLERRRGRPRVLAREALAPLVLEAPGTLVWRTASSLGWRDLLAPPVVDGCPRRTGHRAVFASPAVLVTQVDYSRGSYLRACVRGTERDPVIAAADPQAPEELNPTRLEGVTAGFGQVAFARWRTDRYLSGWIVEVVDLATLATVRRASFDDAFEHGPARGTPFVVTGAGAPVWIAPSPSGSDGARVLAVVADGRVAELDRGSDLRDLRAEGEEVVWSNGGEPRRARP